MGLEKQLLAIPRCRKGRSSGLIAQELHVNLRRALSMIGTTIHGNVRSRLNVVDLEFEVRGGWPGGQKRQRPRPEACQQR